MVVHVFIHLRCNAKNFSSCMYANSSSHTSVWLIMFAHSSGWPRLKQALNFWVKRDHFEIIYLLIEEKCSYFLGTSSKFEAIFVVFGGSSLILRVFRNPRAIFKIFLISSKKSVIVHLGPADTLKPWCGFFNCLTRRQASVLNEWLSVMVIRWRAL